MCVSVRTCACSGGGASVCVGVQSVTRVMSGVLWSFSFAFRSSLPYPRSALCLREHRPPGPCLLPLPLLPRGGGLVPSDGISL